MKLARFNAPDGSGPHDGVVDGDSITTDAARYKLDEVELLAPLAHPGTIYAIGLNYADHVAEMGHATPERPVVFVKVSTSSTGPTGPVHKPDVVQALDYEGELVLVIGEDRQIAGYAIADDVSSRDLQQSEPHWIRAKGADTFCPWGPWITTADEIPDPENLTIRTWVNGELRQDSNTSNLIFGPQQLVEFISQTCTLRPGDLILTGTPGGVGQGFDPPRLLQSGDVVRIEIEGLGSIEHPVA